MTKRARNQWDLTRGRWRIRSIRGGKWWRERGKKGLSAIPHLFTLLNLAFGVVSIILTLNGDYLRASMMVAGSLIADGLDGRLARWLKADGEFGKELDSLADVVSFGTAPAILLYQLGLKNLGYYGMAISLLFPMCGALRLARFNIIKTSGFFLGVPITAAGTLLSCLAFYAQQAVVRPPVDAFMGAVVLVLSYLMISTIPYPDFKKRKQKGVHVSVWPFVGPLVAILAVLYFSGWNPWSLVVLPLTVYVIVGPWLLVIKQVMAKAEPGRAGSDRR